MLQQRNDESFVLAIEINNLVKFPRKIWATDERNLFFHLIDVGRLVLDFLREVAHEQLEVFKLCMRQLRRKLSGSLE